MRRKSGPDYGLIGILTALLFIIVLNLGRALLYLYAYIADYRNGKLKQ